MEEITIEIISAIGKYVSFGYLIVFIFLSYGLRDFIDKFVGLFSEDKKVRKYSVFVIASFLAPFWYFYFGEDPLKLFVTYAVGTSLYELIIQAVITKLKTK